jgi:hypothetical protein
MTAQVYNYNGFHDTCSAAVTIRGEYLEDWGVFVVDDIDDLAMVGGTCLNDDCFCGAWCRLLAELPDSRIVAAI